MKEFGGDDDNSESVDENDGGTESTRRAASGCSFANVRFGQSSTEYEVPLVANVLRPHPHRRGVMA